MTAYTLTTLPDDCLNRVLEFLTADDLATARIGSRNLNERVQTLCASRLADASQRPNSSLVGRIARKVEQQNDPANVRYSKLIYRINKLMHYLLLSLPDDQWNPSENFDHIEDTFNRLPQDYLPRPLIRAARNGDSTALQELLSLDRDRPIPGQNRLSNRNLGDALLNAASQGRAQVVRELLRDDRISNDHVESALRIAASKGHVEVVRKILSNYRSPNLDVGDALRRAAGQGYAEVVRELLHDNRINHHVGDALRAAASQGRVEMVRELLRDYSISNDHVDEALRAAAADGHVEVARTILNGNILDLDVSHALLTALVHEQLEVIRAILNSDIPNPDVGRILFDAASHGELEAIRAILTSDITNPNVSDALDYATRNGRVEIVRVILNTNRIPGYVASRPLRDAAADGHVEMVRTILNANIPDLDVYNALCRAGDKGHIEVVRELLGDNRTSFANICSALLSALVNGQSAVARELFSNMVHRVLNAFSRYFS